MDSDISHLLRHSVVDVECKHECLACERFEVCIPPLPSGPGGISSPVESVSVPKFKSPDGFLTCIHALSARTDVVRNPQRSIPIRNHKAGYITCRMYRVILADHPDVHVASGHHPLRTAPCGNLMLGSNTAPWCRALRVHTCLLNTSVVSTGYWVWSFHSYCPTLNSQWHMCYTEKASPTGHRCPERLPRTRTPTQRTFQPQEAVQPQRNQTILQADTPSQKWHM